METRQETFYVHHDEKGLGQWHGGDNWSWHDQPGDATAFRDRELVEGLAKKLGEGHRVIPSGGISGDVE